ncbi:MAG: carbohydrate binding domain-containing protein [Chloroflexota bacterium]
MSTWEDLFNAINKSFNFSELKLICFALGKDWENIASNNSKKYEFIIELLKHCKNNDDLSSLLENLRAVRPHIKWTLPENSYDDFDFESIAQKHRRRRGCQITFAFIFGLLIIFSILFSRNLPINMPIFDDNNTNIEKAATIPPSRTVVAIVGVVTTEIKSTETTIPSPSKTPPFEPTVTSTNTSLPSATATNTPIPTVSTNTPISTSTQTKTPNPTTTPIIITNTPKPTNTTVPTETPTNTPTIIPTDTPTTIPTNTPTLMPTATATPSLTATATLAPACVPLDNPGCLAFISSQLVSISESEVFYFPLNQPDSFKVEYSSLDSVYLSASLKITFVPTSENRDGGWGVDFRNDQNQGYDFSNFDCLTFYYKGSSSGQQFQLKFKDEQGHEPDNVTIVIPNHTSWSPFQIRLNQVNFPLVDFDEIVNLNFGFNDTFGSGMVYIDHIQFLQDPNCPP